MRKAAVGTGNHHVVLISGAIGKIIDLLTRGLNHVWKLVPSLRPKADTCTLIQ